MPLYNQFFYNQKWSVWNTWRAFGRTIRVYLITAGYRMGNLITTQKRRTNIVTTQKRRGNIVTGV